MKQMINTQPKNNLVAVDRLELDHMDLEDVLEVVVVVGVD